MLEIKKLAQSNLDITNESSGLADIFKGSSPFDDGGE
jgi:hypothetical protein